MKSKTKLRNRAEIEQEILALSAQLTGKVGSSAHGIREKIRILNWVLRRGSDI